MASLDSLQKVPVKVALIDDGVDPNPDVYAIEDGISFSSSNRSGDGPDEVFPSTEGHGTAMATIISKICPIAKLYVAKMDGNLGSGSFTAMGAAKVDASHSVPSFVAD
jgi:subtilisin family serine protease